MTVYADNAATTKVSDSVLKAMLPYFTECYGNASSLYSFGQKSKEALENARSKAASLIGAQPHEIYFTSGGSESDNQAIVSAALLGEAKGKKHIVSTAFEHHAVLHTLDALKKRGFEITLLPVYENGIVHLEDLENAVTENTCLVTVMYANNEIGTIQPVAEIGAFCKSRNIIFHTDAVQAAGHLKIDVNEQNIDMLSISAHKFRGPKGTGLLYVRNGIKLTPLINGGAQERGKRAGTENLAGIIGLTTALSEAYENAASDNIRVKAMRDRLIEGLSGIPHSILNGDRDSRLPGNVNFCFEGIEGESLLLLLDDRGIFASSGSACTSGSLDPSHVLLAIGRPHEVAHGSLRLTLSAENTDEEVEYIIDNVRDVVSKLRNMSPVWRDLTEGKKEFVLR